MKLTGRQQGFLSAFLDLYHKSETPLHYSQIASELGVSAITAYDMLRILEKRGLVRSDYTQQEAKRGRTSIVFSPTEAAQQLFMTIKGEISDYADWEQFREHVLTKLGNGEVAEYQELVEELLDRLPVVQTPMLFLTEMVAAVIISLQLSHGDLVEKLRAAGFPKETGLSAVEGLAVGLSLAEKVNRSFLKAILIHNKRFAALLAACSGENHERLVTFVDELMGKMERPAESNEQRAGKTATSNEQ
jgi:DNA-binding MarR family transcriptional regulator